MTKETPRDPAGFFGLMAVPVFAWELTPGRLQIDDLCAQRDRLKAEQGGSTIGG